MTVDDLIPPSVRNAVTSAGLHKIAGAMAGVPEMGLKEAATVVGMKAWLRRKEARAIADGIAAYGTLVGEKIAENPVLTALLKRSVMPALGGAAIAAVPHLLSNDPNQGSVLPAMGIGALLGGAGGAIRDIGALPGPLNQSVANALEKRAAIDLRGLLRAAAMPALTGAAVGGISGAVANKDDRSSGALHGALTGGALGGLGGALHQHLAGPPGASKFQGRINPGQVGVDVGTANMGLPDNALDVIDLPPSKNPDGFSSGVPNRRWLPTGLRQTYHDLQNHGVEDLGTIADAEARVRNSAFWR